MRALLLVDVQNDFLPGGSMGIPGADAILEPINRVQEKFPLVVATKDWHPENHCSFASRHGKKVGEVIEFQGVRQELWPDHCIQHTQGAEFSPQLNTDRIARVFHKGTDPDIDSYSTFFDNAHKRSTGLADYLKEQGVTDITLAGLATDYCVLYSIRDAHTLGFSLSVLTDACYPINLTPDDEERALSEMRSLGVHLLTTQQL